MLLLRVTLRSKLLFSFHAVNHERKVKCTSFYGIQKYFTLSYFNNSWVLLLLGTAKSYYDDAKVINAIAKFNHLYYLDYILDTLLFR